MPKNSGLMFKPDMILAYINGEKNQTRRTKGLNKINENPDEWEFLGIEEGKSAIFKNTKQPHLHFSASLPYGCIFDTLYFKETWKMWSNSADGEGFLHYRADDAKVRPTWWTLDIWKMPDPFWYPEHAFTKWQSSMFMPRLCSRFREVPILSVHVERLWDITEEDAKNEGCKPIPLGTMSQFLSEPDSLSYRLGYFRLWDEINGKTLPSSKNLWLFVYKFPRFEGLEGQE